MLFSHARGGYRHSEGGGGAKIIRARKIFRPRPQNGRDRVQMAAERPVFDIFGVFL